jgi:hypothetical protein
MGITAAELDAILVSRKYVTKKDKMLTLGRQMLYMPHVPIVQSIEKKHNFVFGFPAAQAYWSEILFHKLGFGTIDSMDKSRQEGASIIHDLNKPVPEALKGKYSYIYDGGTTEHVFNIPQVCANIMDMLEVGGIYVASIPNNNMSGHGFYQFSPDFFLSAYAPKYGAEVLELYITEFGQEKETWKDVNALTIDKGDGRNTTKFDGNAEVLIVAIIRKTSDTRLSILTDPPQQFFYS